MNRACRRYRRVLNGSSPARKDRGEADNIVLRLAREDDSHKRHSDASHSRKRMSQADANRRTADRSGIADPICTRDESAGRSN